MLSQRGLLRSSQRFISPIRSSTIRAPLQRRFAGSQPSHFTGAEDNAFNREREAVKEHAAATSGKYRVRYLRSNEKILTR